MRKILQRFLIISFSGLVGLPVCTAQSLAKSQWVYPDAKGKLVYKTLEAGDKIMDFSYAGYMGGGVAYSIGSGKNYIKPYRRR